MSAEFLPVINCPICDEGVPVPVVARLIPYLVDGHDATVRLTADWSVHECFPDAAAKPTEVGEASERITRIIRDHPAAADPERSNR